MSKDWFYLPDSSRKLQLQGISKRSNANGTSAAARLSAQTSGDGHGGFISWRCGRKKNGREIFHGGVLSDGEKGHLCCERQNTAIGMLSSGQVKGQIEERQPRTDDLV